MADVQINIPAMQRLVGAVETALADLPRRKAGLQGIMERVYVDSSPAAGLDKIVTWGQGELPGLRRRLALAISIEAQRPGWQATVSIPESQLPADPPEVAIRRGQLAAQGLKDSHGKPDDDLLNSIQAGMNDPYFAHGFATSITPAELGQVVLAAGRDRDSLGMTGTATAQDYADWEARYRRMLTVVGTTLATATRGTGDLAMPADYAQQWVTAITDPPYTQQGHSPPGSGAAAAMFLRNGVYATPFLDTVSVGVYDYERATAKDGPLWRPRSQIDSTYLGAYAPDGGQAYDPLESVMAGLGHNAEAAQHFFTGGGTENITIHAGTGDVTVPVNGRMKYLIDDRVWPTENGDGLGNALEAASTTWRDRGPQGQVSAQIASQAFALIGDKTGQGAHDGIRDWGPWADNGWQMPTAMRDSVARMLSTYMPDVFRVAPGGNSSDTLGGTWYSTSNPGFFPPDGGPYGAVMDKKLMENLLGTIGQNDQDVKVVLAGAAATYQLRLSQSLAMELGNNPNVPALMIKGMAAGITCSAANDGSTVFGFIVNSAYQGAHDDEELAKKRAEALKDILTVASSLPPLKIEAGPWTTLVIDETKSRILDKIGEGPSSDASGTYSTMDEDTKAYLEENTFNALLAAGYLEPKYYAQANRDVGGASYQPPDPGAFKRDASGNPVDPPEFDFGSDAFKNWYHTYGGTVRAWIDTNVVTPYNNAWSNVG